MDKIYLLLISNHEIQGYTDTLTFAVAHRKNNFKNSDVLRA